MTYLCNAILDSMFLKMAFQMKICDIYFFNFVPKYPNRLTNEVITSTNIDASNKNKKKIVYAPANPRFPVAGSMFP